MNRHEASLFIRLRVVPCSPVPPNKAMQTDGASRLPLNRSVGRPGTRCVCRVQLCSVDLRI